MLERLKASMRAKARYRGLGRTPSVWPCLWDWAATSRQQRVGLAV